MMRREWQRLKNRIIWSWAGWRDAWSQEPSLKFWTCMNVPSAALALYLPLSRSETMIILMGGVLVLAVELINTSLERTVDYISTEPDDRARVAKDVGSAGVAMTAVAVGVAWAVVLLG